MDVLSSLPATPYAVVASLWAPGSNTFATAVVYERCPEMVATAGWPPEQTAGVRLLIKRARELGADAIVLHDVGLSSAVSPASFGIH